MNNNTLYNNEIIKFLIKEEKIHNFIKEFILEKTRIDIDNYDITFDKNEIEKNVKKFEINELVKLENNPIIFEGIPKKSYNKEITLFLLTKEYLQADYYQVFSSGTFIYKENPTESLSLHVIYI